MVTEIPVIFSEEYLVFQLFVYFNESEISFLTTASGSNSGPKNVP